MTGTETMNQHTILATRLGDLTVVRNAEAVVGLVLPASLVHALGRTRSCHRVVGSNGKLAGYAGGLKRKRAMLELEQLTLGPVAHEALVTVGGVAGGGSSARRYRQGV